VLYRVARHGGVGGRRGGGGRSGPPPPPPQINNPTWCNIGCKVRRSTFKHNNGQAQQHRPHALVHAHGPMARTPWPTPRVPAARPQHSGPCCTAGLVSRKSKTKNEALAHTRRPRSASKPMTDYLQRQQGDEAKVGAGAPGLGVGRTAGPYELERRATSISASRRTRHRWALGCLGRADVFVKRDWGPA
jgi:hypothetical protein